MSQTPATGPTPGYRPCVGIMLLNDAGEVFLGRREDQREPAWQMPQGGIDKGEDPRHAARRELREEAGTDRAEIVAEMPGWLDYDLPAEISARKWRGRWRGQSQKWFAMRFTGTDADIRLDSHHPEFVEWRWVAMETVPSLIVPFKRPVYEAVVAAFRHLAGGEGDPES